MHKAVKLDDSQYPAKLQLLRNATFLDRDSGAAASGEEDALGQSELFSADGSHKEIMQKLETQKMQLTQSVVARKLVGIPTPWLSRFLAI